MIYLQLFLSFLQVGAFSFGGGYAAMPLIKQQVITAHHWLSVSEFTDLISISQMTPGPIAVNSATFVGIKIAGIPGAICATIGCVLPSCIIVGISNESFCEILRVAFGGSNLSWTRDRFYSLFSNGNGARTTYFT